MSWLFLLVVLNVWLVSCDSQPKTIFLLAGQSNMSGRGGVNNDTHVWDHVIPLECQPNPLILKLEANLKWVEAHEPLHVDIDVLDPAENATHGIGPGMPFAHAILKMKPSFGSIGLVPCAHQRSHIKDWQRGTPFYNLMMKRAEASMKNGAIIGGLLWWQGGADASNEIDANSFKNATIKFYNDVRADLKSPELPIMQVLIPKGKDYADKVREDQQAIQSYLPKMITEDSSVLPFEHDNVHVTSQGQVTLGTKLAEQFLSLINQ